MHQVALLGALFQEQLRDPAASICHLYHFRIVCFSGKEEKGKAWRMYTHSQLPHTGTNLSLPLIFLLLRAQSQGPMRPTGETGKYGKHPIAVGSSSKGDHQGGLGLSEFQYWKLLQPRKTFSPGITEKVGHATSSPWRVQPCHLCLFPLYLDVDYILSESRDWVTWIFFFYPWRSRTLSVLSR